MNIIQRIKYSVRHDYMAPPRVRGFGYEALVIKDGVVVGRVYLGTVEDVER